MIRSVGNRQLNMEQFAWQNQIIGYDTVNQPNADFGVWVQNALALMSDGGQFYLDSKNGKVYYKPLAGENMATAETYLGLLEAIVVVGGTYDNPAHDITFQGITISHSTWLKPVQGYGYVDQQTGGYIGDNTTYPQFEATRPHWMQMPSAVQISAAQRVSFLGNNYTQLGAGGVGIGNDPNAHVSGVGLGASDVTIGSGYFTQVMGNSITAGGIQANAHYPTNSRMINTRINISNNIFFNTSALFSSTVPISASYVQYSNISHNDLFTAPYSGICIGYGWGSNDAGGSPEYQKRGLYNYQPKYTTPTTFQNVNVDANIVHRFGLSHTDLGGIYTLSKSPGSRITSNYVYDSQYYGLYDDEGSNSYVLTNNILETKGPWSAINGQNGGTTGNLTITGNWAPGASGGNYAATDVSQTGTNGMRVAYRAGVEPRLRNGRPVSNDQSLRDGNLDISSGNGQVIVKISNFDDVDFTGVTVSVSGGLTPVGTLPTTVPANSAATAAYRYSGNKPSVSVTVKYTNPRTGKAETLTGSG
ncbi:hypothetical protein QBC46DRAFT_40050 [Diplogelasinospora grovesii]|uniref:Uncharacterized protein n=1 Tax=Diplogelasinospora grovesii TaxID=303347 RepID=A0AAN6NCT7_9PEZI|nr:hypothetical protein QBC46DRAFT_40050 [Diplogelasinospora grovesii]